MSYEQAHARGVRILCRRDRDLAGVVRALGSPPVWVRDPGFGTLLYIILEQQVSLASARAAYERLLARVRRLTPRSFLSLDDDALLGVGFSRQKRGYARSLAHAILNRRLDLEELSGMEDEDARALLIQQRGIGPWTANIYLMMALRRLDVWPAGDLALAAAVQRVKRLRTRPHPDRLARLGEQWRPWRSVAARIFWHHYLNGKAG